MRDQLVGRGLVEASVHDLGVIEHGRVEMDPKAHKLSEVGAARPLVVRAAPTCSCIARSACGAAAAPRAHAEVHRRVVLVPPEVDAADL